MESETQGLRDGMAGRLMWQNIRPCCVATWLALDWPGLCEWRIEREHVETKAETLTPEAPDQNERR